MKKVTVKEYATLEDIGVTTVYRYIKSGKLQSEKVDGNTYIILDENQLKTNDNQSDFHSVIIGDHIPGSKMQTQLVETQQEMIGQLQSEVEHLREHLSEQTTEKSNQMKEMLKQQDQAQQIIAMQQKSIDKLTEQNQQLHEASQEKEEKKVSFWSRLVGQRAWFSSQARSKPVQINT